jgi:FKBP-type peptidyl-prolyl cis-trans isomerase SlyD
VTKPELEVSDDLVVSLEYTLRLDDGEVIDASAEDEPLEFLQGQGQIIPGLEQTLYRDGGR